MSSIAQVSDALKRVLTERAKELERETGFVERSTAQLDGPTFVHTTVFGWMDTPEASYAQLRHVAASLGVPVSTQAVEQRFGAESAALLREVLQEAVKEVLTSEVSAPELLSRFNPWVPGHRFRRRMPAGQPGRGAGLIAPGRGPPGRVLPKMDVAGRRVRGPVLPVAVAVALPAAAPVAALGWAIPLGWQAADGAPVSATARVVAALAGLPPHAGVVTILAAAGADPERVKLIRTSDRDHPGRARPTRCSTTWPCA